MNIAKALREIIKKHGMTIGQVAKAIGYDRASLYRTLGDDGNPERKTMEKILDYLGYDLKFIKRKEVKPVSQTISKEEVR